jgi:SAM-dependent methyltransferase
MSPLINWEELRQITMPPEMSRMAGGEGGNTFDTDQSADMYNQIAKMEKVYTLNQINAFDTAKTDTVLDIGCGPGRITVPMAQRARSVTSIDSSERMLRHCRRNAEEAGLTNVNARLLDWRKAALGENLEQHDIVIASRSVGSQDLKKVSSFARKYVVVIAWANAPNIPTVVGDLYAGVEGVRQFPPMRIDRRVGYNITYNQIYDAGYDPNVRIVLDGFTKDFASREEAYRDLWRLQSPAEPVPPPLFKQNVDKWLSPSKDGGVTFRRETRSFVIWWEPEVF